MNKRLVLCDIEEIETAIKLGLGVKTPITAISEEIETANIKKK